MTSVYLINDTGILCLYRVGSRVANNQYIGSAGGHFEPEELNDPRACVLREMEEELGDVYADVAKGDLSKVTAWLKEKIHRHASFKKPGALFEEVCGKFDASYYTDYLTKKFTELYDL